MRYFFIIQGEGRGHMTQAIALGKILRDAGHEIVHTVVGKSPARYIPDFFVQNIHAPVTQVESPNFVTDKKHRSVKPMRTIVYSLWRSKVYRKSIDEIARLVDITQPDVIINFYDFLGGIYNFFYRPKSQFVCVAHQFLMAHPEFTFPKGHLIDRSTLLIANKIASLGSAKTLALSFQPFEDLSKKRLYVVPPLLRHEVMQHQTTNQGHLLVYMVNPGYGPDVEAFHKRHPAIQLIGFWDHKSRPEVHKIDDNLVFHQLHGQKFLDYMASARGLVCTAGFESVCEAMYLGKPVMMVPVEGHYEQMCNAIDATKAMAGIASETFDIKKLIDYLPDHVDNSHAFKAWVEEGKKRFLQHLC